MTADLETEALDELPPVHQQAIRAEVRDYLTQIGQRIAERRTLTKRQVLKAGGAIGLALSVGSGGAAAIAEPAVAESTNEVNVKSTELIVYRQDGTIFAVDGDEVVASGCDPHAVINEGLSVLGKDQTLRATGHLGASTTTIELSNRSRFHFDYLNYTGTGYVMENPQKGRSSRYNIYVQGDLIVTDGNGIDTDSMQQFRFDIGKIVGDLDDKNGTIGVHFGNPSYQLPSWWGQLNINYIDGFGKGAHFEGNANRVGLVSSRIHRSGTHGIHVEDASPAHLAVNDVTGASIANVEIGTAEVYGHVVIEDSTGQGADGLRTGPKSYGLLYAPVYNADVRYNLNDAGMVLIALDGTFLWPPKSSPPNPKPRALYLDDGSNTQDASPGWRWNNGNGFVDL